MKKISKKILAIMLVVAFLFGSTLPVSAQSFSTNSLLTTSVSGHNWMNGISDSTALTDITMPGTHDSGTRNVDLPAWSKTQTLSITEQLNIGVRYFDLRLEHVSDVYYNAQIVHGSSNCWNDKGGHLTLYEVLEDMYAFLNANPSETLIVSVKQDYGNDINALANDVNTLIDLRSNYWFTGYYTPNLGSVRGKCVLATRISEVGRGISLSWGDQGSDGGAVDSGWMKVQDRYKMGASSKWSNAVKPMLDETKPNGVWYVNFLSTTGGGIAGVEPNAGTMNGYFRTYEMMNNKCYGIVIIDYATDDLCSKIYKANDLVAKIQPNSEGGQYYYRLNLNTWDDVPSSWQGVSCRLYYKTNNGTGEEKSVLLFDQSDAYKGYAFVATVTNNDFTGCVDGYPTRVQMYFNWSGNDGIGIDQRLYVSRSPSDNLTLVAKDTVRYTTPTNTTNNLSVQANTYPQIKSVAFADASDLTVSAPDINSDTVNQYTLRYNIYDQYNVKWQRESAALTTDTNYPGVTVSGNKLLINKSANDISPNTSFNVYASYTSSGSTLRSAPKRITVTTNKIPYKFVNYDGTVLASGSEYAGVTPQYNGQTPKREPDENGHYTFTSWTPLKPLSVENNTYIAFYTANNHLVSKTVVQKQATCTQSGLSTNYCTCGYSWTSEIPATGHSYITVSKAPTCTEDGYRKVVCRIDGDVKENTVLPATGHDTKNAVRGEYVAPTGDENGYIPYYCPVCNEEILSMREYDAVNLGGYYDALGVVDGIKNDPDYSAYNSAYVAEFEQAVAQAKQLAEDEEKNKLQSNIDEAASRINAAVAKFSSDVGVNYYTLTFVFDNGVSRKLTYKEGTAPQSIAVPANTATVNTENNHTIYRWETVKTVTKNKTYVESSVTKPHTFNTYIAPDIEHTGSCIEDVTVEHRCICGYSYSEVTGKGDIHNWGEWTSNGDGTHTKHCLNDSSHTETDNCVINPQTHSCVICSYKLNTKNYEDSVELAKNLLKSNNKQYSQEKLDELQVVLDRAQQEFMKADSQEKIDSLNSQINAAVFGVIGSLRYYTVKFTYVIDDKTSVVVSQSEKSYNTSVTLDIPSSALENATVEKWTVMIVETGLIKKCRADGASLTFDITDNVEYVAYIKTDKTENAQKSKITLTDNNGRVTQVVYVENAEYTVSKNGNVLTLTNGNTVYTFTAKNVAFRKVSGFTVDGEAVGDTFTVSSDTVINALYS